MNLNKNTIRWDNDKLSDDFLTIPNADYTPVIDEYSLKDSIKKGFQESTEEAIGAFTGYTPQQLNQLKTARVNEFNEPIDANGTVIAPKAKPNPFSFAEFGTGSVYTPSRQTVSKADFVKKATQGSVKQARSNVASINAVKVGGARATEVDTNSKELTKLLGDDYYEMGALDRYLKKTGLVINDDNMGTVYVGKTQADIDKLKNARTHIEYGESYGYSDDDIASFYMHRAGRNPDIAYNDYMSDIKLLNYTDSMQSSQPDAKPFFSQLSTSLEATNDIHKIDTSAVPAEIIEKAKNGDKEAFDEVAKGVFSRTFETIANKNTGDQLKPMVLDKLMKNPNIIEELAKKFGYNVRYFSSNPDNLGRRIGNTVVEERPANRRKLEKNGYKSGNIWVYDPYDTHGSFNDAEYTKAWRSVHELAHAITERIMEAKYGKSRRFGALGNDTRNPYDSNDPRTYKALSTEEAQRAIEWEDVAFRTQLKLLDDLGIPVNKQEAINDFNIAGSDTIIRTLTGDFSDPAHYGVIPRNDTKRIDVKDTLELLQNQEKEIAKYQDREATKGINLDTWKSVPDDELDLVINKEMNTGIKTPIADKDSNLFMSIEAVAGDTIDEEAKRLIQSLPYKEQENFLKDTHKALTDQAGTSIIAKELGLEVGEGVITNGVWKGEVNPVLQLQVKPEVDANGFLLDDFTKKLDTMASIYTNALKQDGVGWNMANYKDDLVENQNSLEFFLNETPKLEVVKELSSSLDDISAIISTNNSIRFINVSNLSNKEFIRKIEAKLDSIETAGEVKLYTSESNIQIGNKDGNYKDYSSNEGRPDLQEWYSKHIWEQARRVEQRYTEKARRYLQAEGRGEALLPTKVREGVRNEGQSLYSSPTVGGALVGATGIGIGAAVSSGNDNNYSNKYDKI